MRKSYYDPNSEVNLSRSQAKAERRLREIELRRDIARVTHQIALLENMKTVYPSHVKCSHSWCEPFDGRVSCKRCGVYQDDVYQQETTE